MDAIGVHTLGGLSAMRTYTFGQCARLLDVDPKVFRRWLKEDLGLQESDQVSRADRRVRYLTREQVERLADLHERTLPDNGEQREQRQITAGVSKLIEDRLEILEDTLHTCERTSVSVQEVLQRVQERLVEVEQQVSRMTQWNALLASLPDWMTQIETHVEHLTHPHEQPGYRLAEREVQHRQQIAEVEARYQRQIAELEVQLAQYRTGEHSPPVPPATTRKKTTPRAKHLPKTLVSRSAFAALHHVPDPIVARACNTGKIAAMNGRWLYKSRIIFQALGERGQYDFYHLFQTRPNFTPCKQCPHEIKQE